MNKYYKNFILCGDIDQYCLLCKETFQLIPDIEKHIRWEKHRKYVKDQTCLPKYQKDLIYKVSSKYYCEICNIVLVNMTSVKEHIKCKRHNLLKSNPEAEIKKPAGVHQSGYVLIDKVIISKAQWHSIVDMKCQICNVDVNDVDEHVGLEEHMLNLMQCETKYSGNEYYRKINDTYHCFACKSMYLAEDFFNHLESCENIDEPEVKVLKDAEAAASMAKLSTSTSCIERVEKQLLRTFQEFYIIDEPNNTAVCKFCSLCVAFDFKPLLLHLKEAHNKNEETPRTENNSVPSTSDNRRHSDNQTKEVVDYGKKRSELSKYGKSNHIKLNHNGTKGYCTICDKYLSSSLMAFKEHCNGLIHKGHLELLGLKDPEPHRICIDYSSQSIMTFVTQLQYAPKTHTVVINNAFSISMNNFLLVCPIENNPHCVKTKCFLCNDLFEQGTEAEHCLELKHKDLFIAAVVISRPEEFVRQVRTNLYHCGFCNVTLPFSFALEIHLQSSKHRSTKASQILMKDTASDETEPASVQSMVGDQDQYTEMLANFVGSTRL